MNRLFTRIFTHQIRARPPRISLRAFSSLIQNPNNRAQLNHFSYQYNRRTFSFYSRLLTRRPRRWTRDDLWALLSWLFVGQGVVILVGTTGAASIVLLLANSLQFHDWIARKLTTYLAKHTGLQVSFGDLIVPNWRTGRINFSNVLVTSIDDPCAAEMLATPRCDLHIAQAEVRISLGRLLEGRGLVESCEIAGVRGTIDRRHIRLVTGSTSDWRYKWQRGDFDIDGVSVKDILVTVLSPGGEFRPFKVSIISAFLPRLRKRYLLADMLAAESVVGVFDGSLFSMHIPQCSTSYRLTSMRHLKMHSLNVDMLKQQQHHQNENNPLNWLTRGDVDVDMFIRLPDTLYVPNSTGGSASSGGGEIIERLGSATESLFLELFSGSINDDEQRSCTDETKQQREQKWWSLKLELAPELRELFSTWTQRLRGTMQEEYLNIDTRATDAPEECARYFAEGSPTAFCFKVDLRFHNLRAHAPWVSTMRPLVAYINEQRPYIPIGCHFQLPAEGFDGAWTIYESGIAEALYGHTMEAFGVLLADRQRNMKRLRRVSLWSVYALFRNLNEWVNEAALAEYQQRTSPLYSHDNNKNKAST